MNSFLPWALFVIGTVLMCSPAAANAQAGEWTWMGGTSVVAPQTAVGAAASYGTLGTPAAGNVPGGREHAVTWTDSSGALWLFGGAGVDSVGAQGSLNDLWKFDPASNEWAWISGSNKAGQPGAPGTLGTPSAGNFPGARTGALGWVDKSGNLWLFGGDGLDSGDYEGWLNDLWEFNPSTKEWVWMGGGSALPTGNSGSQTAPGVYGTMGVYATGNVPPGRTSGVSWIDGSGDFWLFGGDAHDQTCGVVYLNDLWEYSATLREWRWMGGSVGTPCNPPGGTYGTLGTPSAGNIPGGRYSAVSWVDTSGNFWLSGGFGPGSSSSTSGYVGDLNDLWEFNPSTNEWTWMSGSSSVEASPAGIYGSKGLPGVSNVPSPRYVATGSPDNFGDIWLFGGNPLNGEGDANDLWVFDPAISEWAWMSGSAVGDQPGVYGSLGQASSANTPGSREGAASWTDGNGNLWLYGGLGADADYTSAQRYLLLNDLWEYIPQRAVAPSFNPAGGAYSSAQGVAISDSSPSAVMYYTVDGTAPKTTSSSLYISNSAIPVSSSQTIRAVAVISGYVTSAVTSASYTINLQPPSFTLGASASSLTVNSGGQGKVTLTVTSQNGFASVVSFACSGLPTGASCSFNPATVTPSGGIATTTQLTFSVGASSANVTHVPARSRYPLAPRTLALASVILILWRRRNLRALLTLMIFAVSLGMMSGCGSGAAGGGGSGGGGTPVTSTVMVTATAGSIQQTAPISLTVN